MTCWDLFLFFPFFFLKTAYSYTEAFQAVRVSEDIALLLLVPWEAWVSALPHTLYLITFPLISILYNSNACHISFFSVSSAKQTWRIVFLVIRQRSSLNIYLIWIFVFHTNAPDREGDFVIVVFDSCLCCVQFRRTYTSICFQESLLINIFGSLPGSCTCILTHS